MSIIKAPFTQDQINSIVAFQKSPHNHPFTCCNHNIMNTYSEGLLCLKCEKLQDWCHDFMANWQWKKNLEIKLKSLYGQHWHKYLEYSHAK